MEDLHAAIQSHFGTTAKLTDEIAHYFTEEVLAKEAFHTRKGHWHSHLSFVQSGYLRIFRPSDKKEATQWIASPGEFVVDINTLLFNQATRWEIQALTDYLLFTSKVSGAFSSHS